MTSGICLNVGCKKSKIKIENIPNFPKNCKKNSRKTQVYLVLFSFFSGICRICLKYAHLVHLLHFYLPQGANFQKFYSKGSILPGSACTCREKRSGKEGKHPSTSTSSLYEIDNSQTIIDMLIIGVSIKVLGKAGECLWILQVSKHRHH